MREWIDLVENETDDVPSFERERKVELFYREICMQIGLDIGHSKSSISYDSEQNVMTIYCGESVALEQVEALKAHGSNIRIDMNHRNSYGVQIELSPIL